MVYQKYGAMRFAGLGSGSAWFLERSQNTERGIPQEAGTQQNQSDKTLGTRYPVLGTTSRLTTMKYKFLFVAVIFIVAGMSVRAQDTAESADTVYAYTPVEYQPYARFENPHYRFFTKKLEYPGYGRHLPEPKNLTSVKLGFIGPVIGSVQESAGGPVDVAIRVNERKTRWDGYQYSHLAPMGIKMMQGAQLAIEIANKNGG